ncbi:uncharacterized protein BX663DRAFT_559352 [Cokeromyces recurvatus]|uniref:uncharacterized protein n=1 Tax=Cokeromyces recurvatus TaxID=90255 RepID=UPI002220989B|nr:uncharacterized protein BX663DRAFT_559352 [Cokeromyces recurvatus]KAI7905132.1 hypothetical protein BX663DRAFT_559352 [Cokeromyces recurvatus]
MKFDCEKSKARMGDFDSITRQLDKRLEKIDHKGEFEVESSATEDFDSKPSDDDKMEESSLDEEHEDGLESDAIEVEEFEKNNAGHERKKTVA